ncbi:MAG: hypothetical protein ACFFDK_14310 [Promethearchaeota archaeon]
MSVLQDIWILSNTGTVLFSRVFESQMEQQLFGALMSALNSFAEQLADGGLSNFELSNKKFVIKKTNSYTFVASCSKKVKEKKLVETLEKVIGKFTTKFPDDWFKEWDCDISTFECFEEDIGDSLENPIKQFWNGF